MAEFRSLKRRAGVAEEGLLIDKERLEEPEQVVHALKRRIGIAEEMVRIKKERLDEADQEYEAEHRTFTIFSRSGWKKSWSSALTRWKDWCAMLGYVKRILRLYGCSRGEMHQHSDHRWWSEGLQLSAKLSRERQKERWPRTVVQ